MEIPYGKREFIAEEEEQQQQQAPPPPPPVEEPSIQVTQENCHIPPHKMVVVQEQHPHVHPMVRRKSLLHQSNSSSRQCKRITDLLQNGLKHKKHPSILK